MVYFMQCGLDPHQKTIFEIYNSVINIVKPSYVELCYRTVVGFTPTFAISAYHH